MKTLQRDIFPIKMAFAVTVNSGEGQTFKHVGIYLPSPVFSLGQLCVAFYFTSLFYATQAIIQDARQRIDSDTLSTSNFVYPDVLVSFRNVE